MMRRGLWQQKQKRPSACLLCRFSFSYGPYTRPALRTPSSPNDRASNPEAGLQTPPPTSGHSARPYSVAASRSRHGGLGSTASPLKAIGLGPLAGVGDGRVCRRTFTTGGLPSWATQPAQPAPAQSATPNDGLLPHERAAREKAKSRAQPPPAAPAQDAQPAASNSGLLPHERAARERAMARAQAPPAAPAQPVANNSRLLPHERAARARAMGRTQPPSAAQFQDARPVAGNNGLLPHERAAKEAAMRPARRPPPPPPPPKLVADVQFAFRSNALMPSGRIGRERAMARIAPLPPTSGGNVQPASKKAMSPAARSGLLPHERAAREKAMGLVPPPPAEPAENVQPASVDKPVSRATTVDRQRPPKQPRPAPAPESSAPAWASAPSWSTPAAQPAAAAVDGGEPPQKTDPLAFLLPHERAARERAAAARKQAQPAAPPPPPDPPAPEPAPAPTPPGNVVPQDEMSRDYVALQSRRCRPFGISARDARQDQPEQSDPFAPTRQPQHGSVPRYDLPRPSSTLTQTAADQSDWKNLARRERKMPPGFGTFAPDSTFDFAAGSLGNAPQGSASGARVDPFSLLEQGAAGPTTNPRASNTGADPFSRLNDEEDQFKVLERKLGTVSKAQKKQNAIQNDNTWAWTQDYAEEARQAKVQRIAREMRQEAEPAKQEPSREEPSANAFPSRRVEREDRYGRADRSGRPDRRGREEGADRWEKPKPKIRRRHVEEDDNWDDDFYEERRRKKAEKAERERQRQAALEAAGPTPIFLPQFISVSNLAIALGQKIDVFVAQLEELGFEEVGRDNILTGETAALVAKEYGFEPTVDAGEDEDLKPAPVAADPSSLPLRPPVVTIMGHVDHGKTTLLDYLRKSSIVAQEHGGITQHIGAFSVSLTGGKQITFLDTPGHAAFLSMRQRGANVTDMVILVVAADDSVMPQTLEALKHARSAKVPIIVAINKVDKPEANVDRVKSDLATHGVEIEDYGGDVQVVCVSGKTGQGMDDLEENVLLLSEMLDIRAEPDGLAEGWVLESTIKPIGRVATVLVKRGTLRPGDFIVAGRVHAKIRSLRNEAGVEVDEAPPGTAIEILGWKEPPDAGDQVLQAPDEGKAKAAVRYRQELKERGEVIGQMAQQEQDRRERDRERERERALAEAANPRGNRRHHHHHHHHHHQLPEDLENGEAADPADKTQYVTFLVKGDVHGSVEAVTAALLEQGNNEIRAKVLVSGPGQITESDVEHAAVSGSSIINFNNPVPAHIKRLASDAGVKILEHNVIYHLVEEVRDKLVEALPPLVIKKVVGEAEVLQVFPINVKGRKFKNIAGCRIGNGYVKRNSKARVIRGGENIFEGTIETLKHVKKDVNEMKKGSECGMSFADWDELEPGDQIQMIEEVLEKRKL